MQADNANRFRDLLRGMGRIYGQEPDSITLDAYWIALREWDLADFEAACAHLMKTAKFMPRPADFHELRKASELTSGEAFSKAMDIARDCTQHGTPTSGNARIDAAARACGGYFAMGQIETVKIGYLERRFSEHYAGISDREDVREALPHLTSEPRKQLRGPRGFTHTAYLEHDEDAEVLQ